MKTLLKLLLGATLAAAVVAFLMSGRGAAARNKLTGYIKEAADLVGVPSFPGATGGGIGSTQEVDDEAIRSKIDETRRRLQDQIEAKLSSRPGTAA